ncbi:MAG: FtsQ-type protein [Devosia sp.]|nr:FtsQ-type protein [Devosia sp.]
MQQVKSEAFFAGARVIEPRQLPVRIRPPGRKLANLLGRAWVLHRVGVIRAGGIMALLAVGGGLIQAREPIGQGLAGLMALAQSQFASAGFAIGEISITGQSLTREQDIFDALGVEPHTSTMGFDVEAARQRIAELPSVDTVSVRKGLPGDIVVTITEKVPVARWRVDGVTFVVDGQGEQIGEDGGAYGDLPLVVGDGAADDALVMIRALQQYPVLEKGLVALSRIADRRWDMIYDTGLRVQLPELGVAQSLRKLDMYQSEYQLLDRDVTVIDLRVESLVAVRPAETIPEETKEQ